MSYTLSAAIIVAKVTFITLRIGPRWLGGSGLKLWRNREPSISENLGSNVGGCLRLPLDPRVSRVGINKVKHHCTKLAPF